MTNLTNHASTWPTSFSRRRSLPTVCSALPAPDGPGATPAATPHIGGAIWVMRALAAVALIDLTYLFVASLTGNPLACTPGKIFDCAAALASPYAFFGPFPVSMLGLMVYGSIFSVLMWLNPTRSPTARKAAWLMLVLLISLAAGAAAWLIALQLTKTAPLCPYCLVSHTVGLMLTILVFKFAPLPRSQSLKFVAIAAVSVLVFVAVQTGFPHRIPTAVVRIAAGAPNTPVVSLDDPQTSDGSDFDTGPGPERQLGILGGRVRLSPRQLPIIGSPDAPIMMVVLFDYTCINCRKLHQNTQSALKRYPGQFATVVLPVPLDKTCNTYITKTDQDHENACELAKLALAVWIAKPAEFEAFNDWMLNRDDTVSVKEARAQAAKRIGADTLEATLQDDRVGRELKKGIKVYGVADRGAIPRIFVPTKNEQGKMYTLQVVGRSESENEFFHLLESELHMKPVK
jgi:uncharacterized membrane protein